MAGPGWGFVPGQRRGGQRCPAPPRQRLLVAPLPAGAFGGGGSFQPIVVLSAGAFLCRVFAHYNGGICQHFPATGPPHPAASGAVRHQGLRLVLLPPPILTPTPALWCCRAHVPRPRLQAELAND